MNKTDERIHLQVTGCFIEHDGRFLLLHRLPNKSQGDKWGIPAGKIDAGESLEDAVIREVAEETGILLDVPTLEKLETITWDFGDKLVTFTPFKSILSSIPSVTLSADEHQAFAWVTPKECYQHEHLMHGVRDLLERTGYVLT